MAFQSEDSKVSQKTKAILAWVLLLCVGATSAFASGEKALVTAYGANVYGNQYRADVVVVNSGGIIAQNYLYHDATGLVTEADIRDAIISDVVAYAQGDLALSSFAAKDILFNNYQIGAPDLAAAKGWLSSEVDGKTTGNTTVMTNNTGRDLIVSDVTIILTDVSGLGTAPVISIGKTSSSYNDIANSVSLAGLGTIGNMAKVTLSSSVPLVANGQNVVCRVSTAAILTTTYKFKCLVSGRFLD